RGRVAPTLWPRHAHAPPVRSGREKPRLRRRPGGGDSRYGRRAPVDRSRTESQVGGSSMTTESRDLTRIVLMVLFILALIVTAFRILAPFLLAIVWASTIAIATWPVLRRIEAMLGKRRGAAVAVMVAF